MIALRSLGNRIAPMVYRKLTKHPIIIKIENTSVCDLPDALLAMKALR